MKKIFLIVLWVTPFFIFAQTAVSDTSAIDEILIKENRLQIPFKQTTRNIEILSKEEIAKLPARSINEVLAFLNGVDVRQRGPFGTQADVSVDGGSFDQTLILLNGVKISDPQTGHHSMNIPIPVDAIERIEVLRGPAARIYGINALTGAINIITKDVDSNSIIAHAYAGTSFKDVETEEGRSGMYYGNGYQLGGTLRKDKQTHQLYAAHEFSNGQRYNSASKNTKLYYEGNVDLNELNKISSSVGYIYNDFGANGYYAAPNDKEAQEIVETLLATISSTHQLSSNFYLSPRISNRYNEDDYRYIRTNLDMYRSLHYNNVFSMELNSRYETGFGDFGLGIESRFENIASNNMGAHDRKNYGAYTEFRTDKIQNLLLNVGAYINYNTQYGWQVFPGIDLGYLLNDDWKLMANIGSSQRIPTFTDLYIQQSSIGNPDLVSENAWQAESAISYSKNNFHAQAGYFYRDISDFIDWINTVGTTYQSMNVGNNKIHGINTSFKYKFSSNEYTHYSINLGYNYLKPSVVERSGDFISRYVAENLKHQAILNLSFHYKNLLLSTANRYNERASSTEYFLSDFRAGYTFANFHVYADVQNIFDVTYIESGAVPMPGIWTNIGVKYNLKGL